MYFNPNYDLSVYLLPIIPVIIILIYTYKWNLHIGEFYLKHNIYIFIFLV